MTSTTALANKLSGNVQRTGGVEKWTFDTNNMTITYYYKAGHEIFAEAIE